MKMNEILSEMDSVLQIEKDDEQQTTLIVPKDPMKPGAIAKDERGNLTLDTKTKGTVDRGIKPGDNVTVKSI